MGTTKNEVRYISLLVIAGIIAYANSLSGAYVLDDGYVILNNLHIRHLWPPWKPFVIFSQDISMIMGRPIYNLSLAINYAISGIQPAGYHIVNVEIHILSAILIFLILRSTFRAERLVSRFGDVSSFLALAISLLWILHPLNTECVTYITQRTESLMGFFTLLTLYSAIRGFKSPKPVRWYAMAIVAYILGMEVKQTALVTAILVLLYDRTFISGSFRGALQKRKMLYIAFLVPLILVVIEVVLIQSATAVLKSGLISVSPIEYAMTQPGVLIHYLKLSFWPHPLILYYWWPVVRSLSGAILPGSLILILLIATVMAFWKWPSVGFLGAWFFIILAPTSSIVPIPHEIAAEHRMYLPLIAIITLFVVILQFVIRKLVIRRTLVIGISIILGLLTYLRNTDYYSAEGMWRNVIATDPDNPFGYVFLGEVLINQYRYREAIVPLTTATFLLPNADIPQCNLGIALRAVGCPEEALTHFEKAVERDPNHPIYLHNLGSTYAIMGKHWLAIPYLRKAYQMKPEKIEWLRELNQSLVAVGRAEEIPH